MDAYWINVGPINWPEPRRLKLRNARQNTRVETIRIKRAIFLSPEIVQTNPDLPSCLACSRVSDLLFATIKEPPCPSVAIHLYIHLRPNRNISFVSPPYPDSMYPASGLSCSLPCWPRSSLPPTSSSTAPSSSSTTRSRPWPPSGWPPTAASSTRWSNSCCPTPSRSGGRTTGAWYSRYDGGEHIF